MFHIFITESLHTFGRKPEFKCCFCDSFCLASKPSSIYGGLGSIVSRAVGCDGGAGY